MRLTLSRWRTVLSIPTAVFLALARLAARNSHLSASFLCFAILFGLWRLAVLIMLGHAWTPVFPEARALFITVLATVPSWGVLRYHRSKYTALELDDRAEGVDNAPRRTVHRSPKSWKELNFALFPLWLGYFSPFQNGYGTREHVQKRGGYGKGEKFFIAAMFYNNEAVLPYWTREITKPRTY
ncbi:Glycosyltransferase family 69 protein [Mycena venus]|uniref:Glycosyltransferase family 69 protein n=1 Tax=Mycena venus TaxID=2733690 RepID=A0A8H6X3Z6_9AGAR|nr:Glycosyltransferase family 69 protein [Mycena venus]